MGDYLPPADTETTVVESCDVEVRADADQVAYDRGLGLDVCLDVDLGEQPDVEGDVDADLTDGSVSSTGRDDGALEVL